MKKIETMKIRLPVYYCDGCGNQVSVLTNKKSYFRKGAFQCGENKKGEIATWCNEKCFQRAYIEKGEEV